MTNIKRLSDKTIKKIAAGEVIEHPATVVKELAENSIDAGATEININIEGHGFDMIQAIDNGVGMTREDLKLSYLWHTTSKINDYTDLHEVNSLGFRGEALASIAASSDLEIKTKERDAKEGYFLQVKHGELLSLQPVGIPDGTNVVVKNLFSTTPARKKFVSKNLNTMVKISENVLYLAIANPNIKFTLKHNKKVVLQTKATTLKERVKELLGSDYFSHLVYLESAEENIKLFGYLAKPSLVESPKNKPILIVNKRVVKNSALKAAVKTAYATLLEKHAAPFYILNLEVNPRQIDVNLHPRKETVEFNESFRLTERIQDILTDLVNNQMNEIDYLRDLYAQKTTEFEKSLAYVLKDSNGWWNIKNNKPSSKNEEILQLHNLFLVIETKEGFALIDQHAAHERILYEEFTRLLNQTKQNITTTAVNLTFEVPVNLKATLESSLADFKKVGFLIKHVKNIKFRLTTVPSFYDQKNAVKIILETLADVSDSLENKTLEFLACRSAIKSGDYLTQEERKNLVYKLAQTKTKQTCPHGRPVRIDLKLNDIFKGFKRK